MDPARLRPHHSGTHISHAAAYASIVQNSDDGYDYNVVDDAPEAQATKPKEKLAARGDQNMADSSALGRSEAVDNAFPETTHIFQRPAGGRRAKIPTDIDLDLEKGINGDKATSKFKPGGPVPKFTNIKLRWTMPEIESRRVLQLNYDREDEGAQEPHLHRRADRKAQEPYLQTERVRWQ